MTVDEFLQSLPDANRKLPQLASPPAARAPEAIDALFHLPLLALAIMLIARRTPFTTMVLGRNVALLLTEHFTALRRTPHALELSLTLRRRCADALAFLEAVGLVSVTKDSQRTVSLTEAGKKQLAAALRDRTDLGMLTRQMQSNQERAKGRIGGYGR